MKARCQDCGQYHGERVHVAYGPDDRERHVCLKCLRGGYDRDGYSRLDKRTCPKCGFAWRPYTRRDTLCPNCEVEHVCL